MFLSNHFSETIINRFMKGTLEAVNLSRELFQNALFYSATHIYVYIFLEFLCNVVFMSGLKRNTSS